MGNTTKASAQFTDDAFIGSGALTYPWYADVDVTRQGGDGIRTDCTDWSLTFTDSLGDTSPKYTVTHSDIVRTARAILGRRSTIEVSQECRENCRRMVLGPLDGVDFDSDTADQVLQVAAFGEVIYG